jgi:hypothetical protein
LAQVVHCGLDVFSSRAERDEDGFGVVSLVFGDETVAAAGQLGKLRIGFFEELQNWLGKVVAPRHHALHVVFLILYWSEQDGVGQVHHLGHATASGAKEGALRLGGTVDDVVGRAEILADQAGFMLVEGALEVRGQEAVHDVHAGGQTQLGHAAQDERLIGGLLRVFAKEHNPAGVERAVNVVVAAMHVEGMLGECAGADFEHHGGGFARRVIILLHAVDDALARGEVDYTLSADRVGDGATLGRMFAFGLNGDGVLPEDVQVAFGIGLLEELAALRRRRNGIEDTGVGDARLGVVGNELISICSNPNAGETSRSGHEYLSLSSVSVAIFALHVSARFRESLLLSNPSCGSFS